MSLESFVYRKVDSKFFDYPLDVFGLDFYEADSAGEHEFSRKQVWFYVYGDEDIKTEFSQGLSNLVKALPGFENGEWDYMALMPSHAEGSFNPNMDALLEDVSQSTGMDYRRILHRNHTVRDNHELDSFKERVINSESSIDVQEDVNGKNIVLVDNISNTGCSLLHAKELLKNHGTNNVVAVTLGISSKDSRKIDAGSEEKIFAKLEVEEA